MAQADFNNARRIVVTMHDGTVHTFPRPGRESAWANAVNEGNCLVVYTEGRTETFPIFEVAKVERVEL